MWITTTKAAGPDDFPVFDREFKYQGHLAGASGLKEAQAYAKDVMRLSAPILGRTRRQEEIEDQRALAWATS